MISLLAADISEDHQALYRCATLLPLYFVL